MSGITVTAQSFGDERHPSVLSLTLPTCFREFDRVHSARGVPG